jgi:hypothetical protein
MAILDEPCQRSAAEDLEIVRMRPDGEDTHQEAIAAVPNRRTPPVGAATEIA